MQRIDACLCNLFWSLNLLLMLALPRRNVLLEVLQLAFEFSWGTRTFERTKSRYLSPEEDPAHAVAEQRLETQLSPLTADWFYRAQATPIEENLLIRAWLLDESPSNPSRRRLR